jgi:hypothetical protein
MSPSHVMLLVLACACLTAGAVALPVKAGVACGKGCTARHPCTLSAGDRCDAELACESCGSSMTCSHGVCVDDAGVEEQAAAFGQPCGDTGSDCPVGLERQEVADVTSKAICVERVPVSKPCDNVYTWCEAGLECVGIPPGYSAPASAGATPEAGEAMGACAVVEAVPGGGASAAKSADRGADAPAAPSAGPAAEPLTAGQPPAVEAALDSVGGGQAASVLVPGAEGRVAGCGQRCGAGIVCGASGSCEWASNFLMTCKC